MSIENRKGKSDDNHQDRPYLPSIGEMGTMGSMPLSAVEAHTILVDRAGRPTSELDRLTLQAISDLDDPDMEVDYLAMRKRVARELSIDED